MPCHVVAAFIHSYRFIAFSGRGPDQPVDAQSFLVLFTTAFRDDVDWCRLGCDGVILNLRNDLEIVGKVLLWKGLL